MEPFTPLGFGFVWPPWVSTVDAWVQWLASHPWWLLASGIILYGVVRMIAWVFENDAPATSESRGTARLATPDEIHASPAFHGGGLFVGRLGDDDLTIDPEEDVLAVGPKGIGKSSFLAIMNLLRQRRLSVICLDTSGDLSRLTSRQRASSTGGPVWIVDPRNPRGAHYNLWDGVRWNPWDEVMDLQRIGSALADDGDTRSTDAGVFYRAHGEAALLHAGLFLHYGETAHCSGAALHTFFSAVEGIPVVLKAMANSPHAAVRTWALGLIKNIKPDIIKNIWATVKRWLWIWQDPRLAAVTDDTTMDLLALQHGPVPATLYFRISVEDLQGPLHAFARLHLEQWSARLCDRADASAYDHDLLWLLDDMPELGNLPMIRLTPASRRKFGHRALYICQSFGQLFDTFGPNAGGLFDNCTTWVVFRPKYYRSARLMAEQMDDMTVTETVERTTEQGWGRSSTSRGEQSVKRWVLTPDEIMRIGARQCLVGVWGERWALVDQQRWYEAEGSYGTAAR